MPRGFENYRQPFLEVNSYGQNQNCYYCTVAALHDTTTHLLVGQTEIMMQDTATTEEIIALFRWAGDASIQVYSCHFPLTLRLFVEANIQIGQAVGLAYGRMNRSAHMVVLHRKPGSLECLDYQQPFTSINTAPRYLGFPPEPHIVQYFVFYLG